ncbi:MAG: hypothetical protein ABWX90_03600 [Candidatus Saccharimonadales bacterium]
MSNRSEKDYAALQSKLTKGTRVICRIDRNEWYTGTVTATDSGIEVTFDDGSKSVAANDDLKFVKRLRQSKVTKDALTYDQAEVLWRKTLTRVVYNESLEKDFALNLIKADKPWIEIQSCLSSITTLSPFNELLTLDFRSPVHEYSLGVASVRVEKLTPKIINSLITTAADSVQRFAKACDLVVQRNADSSRIILSSPLSPDHIRMRIHLRIRVGAFKDGKSYVQIAPI